MMSLFGAAAVCVVRFVKRVLLVDLTVPRTRSRTTSTRSSSYTQQFTTCSLEYIFNVYLLHLDDDDDDMNT